VSRTNQRITDHELLDTLCFTWATDAVLVWSETLVLAEAWVSVSLSAWMSVWVWAWPLALQMSRCRFDRVLLDQSRVSAGRKEAAEQNWDRPY
jgi:hypothetical protein